MACGIYVCFLRTRCQSLILLYLLIVSEHTHTRNFFNSIGDPDDVRGDGSEVLKLAIGPKFIRYFITQRDRDMVVYYGDYALQSVSSETDIADQLSNILSKDAILSRSFDRVRVCWFTDFEIVPGVFFDVSELTADAAFNPIMGGDADFIFEVPSVIKEVLRSKFSSISHHHSGAAMIEALRLQGLATSGQLFINVQAGNVEICCFDDQGALRIYNRYEYRAYQDYIYFVLLVADELKLDRTEVKAVLMGEINQDSQLYEMTNRYFANTGFITQPESVSFGRAFEEYPKHFNYSLYNL